MLEYETNQHNECDVLGEHLENYNIEKSALHRKLHSKMEALRILRKDLEQFRTERDQFKLMAETLQLRYSAIRRASELGGCGKSSLANLLHGTRERNIKLTTEVEALKQKLHELQGDIELLRSKEHEWEGRPRRENRLESDGKHNTALDWKQERANLIKCSENLKKKNVYLTYDLKSVIDEKEEIIAERDAYKCKAHRLNHELLIALKLNEANSKFLDIDGIILENKFLHERLKNLENELELTKNSSMKYKAMLEMKRKKGIIKLGTHSDDDNLLSHKQVKSILESGVDLPTKAETIQDLKSLCLALLDNLNDKNLALSHQKQTNKILASKVVDLERRIQLMIGLDTDSTCLSEYSPSEILLYGYCPPSMDSNEQVRTPPSARNTDDEAWHKLFPEGVDIASGDSDELCSTSTESGPSVLSSEYGTEIATNNLIGSIDSMIASSTLNSEGVAPKALAEKRMEDLKDLPPELAAMIQKALSELDNTQDLDVGVDVGSNTLNDREKQTSEDI